MIKKILYIALVSIFAMGVISCESYMEELPQNKMKPSTTDDYQQLLNNGYITEQIMPFLDILGDDAELIASNHVMPGTDMGDPYISAYMWETTHERTLPIGDQAFKKLYNSIFYTNVVLSEVDNAEGVSFDTGVVTRTKNHIKGEALCVRAYAYFYLVNLYGKWFDPETAATDFGVPIVLDANAEDKPYPRNSVQEVYTQMIADLTQGIELMANNPIDVPEKKTKFNPTSAKALLARIYLYAHQWDNAIAAAKDIIEENNSLFILTGVHDGLNLSNNQSGSWSATTIVGDGYLDDDNSNFIFGNGVSEIQPALTHWPFMTTFSANRELAAQYHVDDLRRYYFMYTYDRNTYAGFRSKLSHAKTRKTGIAFSAPTDLSHGYGRVIRTEEMYLILAEAHTQKEELGDAVKYLNDMSSVKYRTGTYVDLVASNFTKETLLTYVFLERRRELCFEGHRWFDLRRSTRPAMTRVGYDNEQASLVKDDPRYVLQIPQEEFTVNPSIEVAPR